MIAKLTQDELQAIKERAEKATSGPWYTEVDGDMYNWDGERIVYDVTNGEGASCVVMRSADRSFIENARQDIPKLVAEVDRLQSYITKIHAEISEYYSRDHRAKEQWKCIQSAYDLTKEALE